MKTERGKIKIFQHRGKPHVQVVTALSNGEETTALFQIIYSPCVICGGVGKVEGVKDTYSCLWCRDTDSIIVLRNDKKEVKQG